MRKAIIVLAVLMQVLVLSYMAGEREYILQYGQTIYLRTAPIDPRDLFRGDYVRLNYEISRLAAQHQPQFESTEIKKGQKVYVNLKAGSNGLFELDHVGLKKPQSSLYLVGRSAYPHKYRPAGYPLWLNYGIEAYFVQQGKGRQIENRRGNRNQIQVPLEMQVAVGGSGKAVIKGHRWSPLGIGLRTLRAAPANRQQQTGPVSARIELALANASDAPLALVNLSDNCSFALETVQWSQKEWVLANDPCEPAGPTEDDVLVLQPDEEKIFEFDFSDKRWFVQNEDQPPVEIGTLDWSDQFRLVYRPPGEAACRHLEDGDLIWHGYLPSRAFHGRGRID